MLLKYVHNKYLVWQTPNKHYQICSRLCFHVFVSTEEQILSISTKSNIVSTISWAKQTWHQKTNALTTTDINTRGLSRVSKPTQNHQCRALGTFTTIISSGQVAYHTMRGPPYDQITCGLKCWTLTTVIQTRPEKLFISWETNCQIFNLCLFFLCVCVWVGVWVGVCVCVCVCVYAQNVRNFLQISKVSFQIPMLMLTRNFTSQNPYFAPQWILSVCYLKYLH